MNPSRLRAHIQQLLKDNGFDPGPIDGDFGPQTYGALQRLDLAIDASVRRVKASSFADPADIWAFRRCKADGRTDMQCFKVGDNGVGLWGDDTTLSTPMCALPREDWMERWGGDEARGKKVVVRANGAEVVCELRDTMPARSNIRNGAGIDLNPAACSALGLTPPVFVTAEWEWTDDLIS